MKSHTPRLLLLALGTCVLGLSGCDKTTAGGSDEIDTRIAVNPSGIPVSGARIVLVPSGDSSGQAAAISATASNGTFPDFQVADGYYTVLVQDPSDSLGKYLDSMRIVAHKVPAGRDTLRALGRIRGVVRMGSGDSPATVVVGLVGTGIVANVLADGTFSIELVPGGLYTLGASSSLQGYGPLYQRLQLRTGQDTLLSDTLVLPFTSLPAPAGLVVTEDTATGNVKVSWSRVVFPDLLGYVLERVEGGVVTDSLYTTDTARTDSLYTYWNSQPLLGPWSARNLAYRVRSRSVSGAPDSRSIAQAFVAQPPNWTMRVDSVKVTVTTDSATGVSTLTWNSPGNPDLVGWTMVRTVDSISDCSQTLNTGYWKDSACPSLKSEILDSTYPSTSQSISHLVINADHSVNYKIQDLRKLGSSTLVAMAATATKGENLVDWRDSGAIESDASIQVVGSWLILSLPSAANSQASRDGVHWEAVPDHYNGLRWEFAGQGDSLWMVALESDETHLDIASRSDSGQWSRKTLSTGSAWYLGSAYGIDNQLVVEGRNWSDNNPTILPLWAVNGDSIDTARIPDFGPILNGTEDRGAVWLTDSSWIEFQLSSGMKLMVHDQETYSRSLVWRGGGSWFAAPEGLSGSYLFLYFPNSTPGTYLGLSNLSGDCSALNLPNSLGNHLQSSLVVSVAFFQNQIWTVLNGHLWKGALHLPPT